MSSPAEADKRTVLIVDDDPVFRRVLAIGLEAAGYRTVGAENGEKAMRIVTSSPPDVILLDMLMPVVDGMQFLRWAKEKARVSIPTLVVTCLDQRTVAVDALVAGAVDVVTKPFGLPAILKKLSTIG